MTDMYSSVQLTNTNFQNITEAYILFGKITTYDVYEIHMK